MTPPTWYCCGCGTPTTEVPLSSRCGACGTYSRSSRPIDNPPYARKD